MNKFILPAALLAAASLGFAKISIPQAQNAPSVRIEDGKVVIESGANLKDIVTVIAHELKRPVAFDRNEDARLQSETLTITEPVRVPAASAGELLESILYQHHFILLPPVADGMPSNLVDLRGPNRIEIRERAKMVDVGKIGEYANRYIMIATLVPVEYQNAREISASLRPFYPDNQLETVTNIGNASALLVIGFGPTVNAVAQLIKTVDSADAPKESSDSIGVRLDALDKRMEAIQKRLDALAPAESKSAAK
ncbi:MAG: hypothetical protein HY286_13620 [Planctomycetes bacterium]|nr:hypothetical protein [Planctomycetota bacterium]